MPQLSSHTGLRALRLRKARDSDLLPLWQLIYGNPEWKQHDAPYEPLRYLDLDDFAAGPFQIFKSGDQGLLIDYQGQVIGTVSYYWVNEASRWLDIGITLYPPGMRSQGLGTEALRRWIGRLFKRFPAVQRIGLSTWSGNPAMIRCAGKAGLQTEGVLRQARYHQDQYYDAIYMGVLRAEFDPPP